MSKQPILLGAIKFNSKSSTLEFFKTILNNYVAYQKINTNDSAILFNLIKRHPEAQQKIGCGIAYFYKAPTNKGSSCFWIKRNDGSYTDFSYISCVNAKSKPVLQEFHEACREAVHKPLKHAKNKFFEKYGNNEGKVECEITGKRIAKHESHLDHKKPMTFQVIVTTFIAANNIKPSLEMLSTGKDNQFVTTFADQKITNNFIEYHNKVAQLCIIESKENLRLGCSERIIKPKNPVILK